MINVLRHGHLATQIADITDLQDGSRTEALLHLEVVVVEVRCPEVLADGENIKDVGSRRQIRDTATRIDSVV